MALARRFESPGGDPPGPPTSARRTVNFRRAAAEVLALLAIVGLCVPAVAASRAASRSGLLFNGSSKSAFSEDQSATNTRIRVVSNPTGGNGTALRFRAYNRDVFPLTPTDNPRAQLITSLALKAGSEFWESYEIYLPTNFPVAATNHAWLGLGSPAYGAPFTAPPSVGLEIIDGHFRFQRNGYASDPWQIAWQSPLVLGHWIRFTWHVRLAEHGYVQLYMNNRPVELADGTSRSTTLFMPVIDQGDYLGPWYSQLSVYYKHNAFPQVTLYFRDFRIATTEALAVAGSGA